MSERQDTTARPRPTGHRSQRRPRPRRTVSGAV